MRHRSPIAFLLLLSLLSFSVFSSPANAAPQPPYPLTQLHSSDSPKYWLQGQNRLYFQPIGETNYWVTDGMPGNTHAIPGTSFCTWTFWSEHSDTRLEAIENVAFYPGPDCQLWRTDGTENGTYRLSQDVPVTADAGMVGATPFDSRLIFLTGDNLFVDGSEFFLWSSDGTPGGTKRLLSLNETGARTYYIHPVVFKDAVYFFTNYISNTNANNRWTKFWRTDGTESGTKIIFDSRTVTDFIGIPEKLVASGNHLFFILGTLCNSCALWQTDGTLSGTQIVSTMVGSTITDMVDVNGTLFLIKRSNMDRSGVLYKTKGVESGGLQVVYTFPQPLSDFNSLSVTAVGNRIFFRNRTGDSFPIRLWVSDGTSNGTHPVYVNNRLTFPNARLVSLGDRVAFTGGQEHDDDDEIWLSDGTEAGTYALTNFDNGDYEKTFAQIAYLGRFLYFSFKDGQNGYDLWAYDYLPEHSFLPMVSH